MRRLTPIMGWSSWNSFAREVDYAKVKAQMDALVRLGLREYGWTYVNIDGTGQSWESVTVQIDIMKEVWPYTRPGSMNDPDMLVAGRGHTSDEDRSHFAMWCLFSSPLLIGQDLTKIRPETLELYKNAELIALDQDPAVLSAGYLGDLVPGVEIWVKLLGDDRSTTRAVALLNRNAEARTVTLDFARVVPNTNTPVVCYCRQYKRAAQAAAVLDALGYRRVYFVGDGYEAAKSPPRVLRLSDGSPSPWRSHGAFQICGIFVHDWLSLNDWGRDDE